MLPSRPFRASQKSHRSARVTAMAPVMGDVCFLPQGVWSPLHILPPLSLGSFRFWRRSLPCLPRPLPLLFLILPALLGPVPFSLAFFGPGIAPHGKEGGARFSEQLVHLLQCPVLLCSLCPPSPPPFLLNWCAHVDSSPYGPAYLSPPPESGWRRSVSRADSISCPLPAVSLEGAWLGARLAGPGVEQSFLHDGWLGGVGAGAVGGSESSPGRVDMGSQASGSSQCRTNGHGGCLGCVRLGREHGRRVSGPPRAKSSSVLVPAWLLGSGILTQRVPAETS